jgi:hypothetical protein
MSLNFAEKSVTCADHVVHYGACSTIYKRSTRVMTLEFTLRGRKYEITTQAAQEGSYIVTADDGRLARIVSIPKEKPFHLQVEEAQCLGSTSEEKQGKTRSALIAEPVYR